jgi:putative hydrolase of the HAD superfamily
MIKAVLFDAGGVIHTSAKDAECEAYFIRETRAVLASCGISFAPENPGAECSDETLLKTILNRAKEYKKWSEMTTTELPGAEIWARYYLKDFSVDPRQIAPRSEYLCSLFDGKKSKITPRPHLLDTVQALHSAGIRQGVVSNIISTTFIPGCLKAYGIDSYMECVVMSSVVGRRKPAREIFQAALGAMNLRAEECAFVGDRLSRDVIGARNAGFGCVIQIRHAPSIEKDRAFEGLGITPDAMIDDLSEIPAIIGQKNQYGGA